MVTCEDGSSGKKDDNTTLKESAGYNATAGGFPVEHETFRIPELYVILAFAAALLSICISVFNIYKHLKNYTRPEFQKSLIRILFIVPVYAVFSWMSLAIPSKSLIFESVRDCWEAVVIYEFLKLILAYCGGESACLLVIMKHPGSVSHMWPFHYCFRPLRLDARFMRICKRFTLQFVLIKPVMALVNIIMLEVCLYTNRTYQMSQLIVYNISYSFALYGLVLFYMATHHHPSLKSRKPLLKFLSIKTIIFATYYQGLLVQLVPGYDKHYLEALNNFIFCWEMIIFSMLHVWAFGWFEFVGGGTDGHGGIGDLEDGGNPPPMAASLALAHLDDMPGSTLAKRDDLHGNVKDAFNMEDVVHDTLENFNTRYEQHVRLDTSASQAMAHQTHEEDEDAHNNPFAVLPATSQQEPVEVSTRSQKNGARVQPAAQDESAPTTSNPFNQQGDNPFNQDELAHI